MCRLAKEAVRANTLDEKPRLERPNKERVLQSYTPAGGRAETTILCSVPVSKKKLENRWNWADRFVHKPSVRPVDYLC